MEIYEVGGCVRDEILGLPSKDIDFTVVLSDDDLNAWKTKKGNLHEPFEVMKLELQRRGYKIFKSDGPFFTVRAKFPSYNGHPALMKYGEAGLTADFVLARKESGYTDGRRPDKVEVGTLEDDLARRDFTMNAVAKDLVTGELIDPHNGQDDIRDGIIRAVGDPLDRFTEDALRAIRGLRFSVTKGFDIDDDVRLAMEHPSVLDALLHNTPADRIREELQKMFRFNTLASLAALHSFPDLTSVIFSGRISLDATMKTKGRG